MTEKHQVTLSELAWPQLPAGSRIRYLWQEWLQDQLEDYQGGTLMTLDGLTQCLSMPDNVFDYHLTIGSTGAHELLADPEALPIQSDAIQTTIASFAMDYTENPSVLLKELHRTLKPKGHLMVLLYAPTNPWHYKAKLGLSSASRVLAKHHIGIRRFKDWLDLLGMEIETIETIGCPWWRGYSKFQKKSEMSNPWLSAPIAYMIKADKKVSSMTPIKPKSKKLSVALNGGLVNVSSKKPYVNRTTD